MRPEAGRFNVQIKSYIRAPLRISELKRVHSQNGFKLKLVRTHINEFIQECCLNSVAFSRRHIYLF